MSNLQFRTKFIDDRTDPFHVYFDINAVNQNGNTTAAQLNYNETRNAPYIMCPEKYFISVVRFDISTNLPVFIPKLLLNQSDANLLDYNMWIHSSAASKTATINFEWTTQGVSPVPSPDAPPNYTYQQLQNDYYYCYSFNYFLNLMNVQIAAALTAASITTLKVWFTMDAATLNLQLNFTATGGDMPEFFISPTLKNLMSSFPLAINPIPLVSSPPSAYEIMWYNASGAALTTPFVINTETSPFPAWNPVSSIVFTTVTLPVIPTNESLPIVYGINTQFGNSTASNNNSATVITDFVVDIGPNSLYNPNVQYLPTAEYRLNDMYGNSPLVNLDLQVWWKDKYNNLYPLLIPAGGSASIKIMFRKKNYSTSSKNVIV